MIQLHETLLGDPSKPLVIFCHGLFGQGKNWTSVAKQLTDDYCVLLLDMPNHGRSAWTPELSYPQMADEVAAWVQNHHAEQLPCAWVGHSMGGKIVMRIALTHPALVSKLCVVDMSPAHAGAMLMFDPIFTGMRSLDLAQLGSRAEADTQLQSYIKDPVVRAFILQNLRHERGRFFWQPNIELLHQEIATLADWPPISAQFTGPVLWIAGANSTYIQPSNMRGMQALFPAVEKVVIDDAGHWVHSEQPEAFLAALKTFLRR